MILKFGKVKLVNASYSIIGDTETNVELIIVTEDKREKSYKGISLLSAYSKIKQVLNLPSEYVIRE